MLDEYSAGFLDGAIMFCAAGMVAAYAWYTLAAETAQLHGTGNLALTVCPKAAPALADGTYAAVAAVFEQPVPLAGNGGVDYTFDLAGTKYRLRYDARVGGVDGWTLTGGDPGARARRRSLPPWSRRRP